MLDYLLTKEKTSEGVISKMNLPLRVYLAVSQRGMAIDIREDLNLLADSLLKSPSVVRVVVDFSPRPLIYSAKAYDSLGNLVKEVSF